MGLRDWALLAAICSAGGVALAFGVMWLARDTQVSEHVWSHGVMSVVVIVFFGVLQGLVAIVPAAILEPISRISLGKNPTVRFVVHGCGGVLTALITPIFLKFVQSQSLIANISSPVLAFLAIVGFVGGGAFGSLRSRRAVSEQFESDHE